MSLPVLIVVLLMTALVAAAFGWFLHQARSHQQQQQQASRITELETVLEMERKQALQHNEQIEQTRKQLMDSFASLSNEALKNNTDQFLKLAQENIKQFHVQSQADLNTREKSFQNLIKPIHATLEKTELHLREVEKERKEAYGSLTRHLESMAQAQVDLQQETRNLVQALRRPEVRGRWGEMTLKRLVELAGMVEYCDFFEQEQHTTDQGGLRPDMIIRLPAGRDIIVDVKTPLDAFLTAVETTDEAKREQALDQHARNVQARVRELASKSYWSQFDNTPDFVVLFIPGDQFLSAALERNNDLLEYALQQRVILATPTSLVALLRAVAFGWRQEALAENADHIRQLGEELYKRLATFTEHLDKVGKNLQRSVESFNKAVGSMDRQVIPGARKLSELGIKARKELEDVKQIETQARTIEKDDS